MVQSMTAFTRQQLDRDYGSLAWEIRSVNHRYLEASVRVPESFRALENTVRDALRKQLNRGKVECQLRFQTEAADGFLPSVAGLEAVLDPRCRALVLVSPNNPTGAVYPADEITAIGHWAVEHGIWVIADEIYEHLTYDDNVHHSMRALVPEIADQFVAVNGVAKTYAMTGWRIGWMIGPDDLIRAAGNLQSHGTSNVANVSQRAALAAVSGDLTAVAEMRESFDRRRRRMTEMLRAIDGVDLLTPQGAFYAFPDLSAFLGRKVAGRVASTTSELATIILEEANVAIVPGEAFGAPGYARLSFALGDDDLGEGLTRIGDLLNG